jgi:hypothetical protein
MNTCEKVKRLEYELVYHTTLLLTKYGFQPEVQGKYSMQKAIENELVKLSRYEIAKQNGGNKNVIRRS